MQIVKSLHAGLLHGVFQYNQKNYFTVSALWAFRLDTGEPVLEKDLWSAMGDLIETNQMFDAGKPKTTGEFLVHGKCYPPKGEPVSASRVVIKLGELTKELYVFGDRNWIKGLGFGWGVSEPEKFTEMSVCYQNAFGGADHPENSLGKGLDEVDVNGEMLIPLPNIEYPDQLVGSPKDKPASASLNRVDITCRQRQKKAGTYDQKYIEERMPGFPDDLNLEYFNDAAEDQWNNGFFSGDESYEILNMHAQHSLLKGKLPEIKARCFITHRQDDSDVFKEIDTVLDTVWFMPGENMGVLIHRGTIDVAEDDATDVTQLMLSHESFAQQPRDRSFYEEQLHKRTDLEQSYKYLMYTAPLIPEGCRCGFDLINESAGINLELLGKKNMEAFAENKQKEIEELQNDELTKMKAQLDKLDIDENARIEIEKLEMLKNIKGADIEESEEEKKIKELLEKILPGITTNPEKPDLSKLDFSAFDELRKYNEGLASRKQQEAEALIKEHIDTLKQNKDLPGLDKTLSDLEKDLAAPKTPPVLPRINVQNDLVEIEADLKKQLEEQRHILRTQGIAEVELANMDFDMSAIKAQVEDATVKFLEGYRIGAHYTQKMLSPHEGNEKVLLDELLTAFRSGKKTSAGDYAYLDFSNQDLTGIDLSNSFLEYAVFDNTNLTGADLSGAILSHATIKNSIFIDAILENANIGNVDIVDSTFKNTNLNKVVLAKSRLNNTVFEQCSLPDKQDMFLETKFDKVKFIDCDLRKNNFIDLDITGCDFSGSDLSESSFINPIMSQAIFSRANLTSVNFVSAQAENTNFDQAEMKNVRFVGGSSLNNASFESASIPEANLRDCALQRAVFSNANLFKADFGGADLTHAKLDRANARQAQFNKADLTHAVCDRIDMMEGSFYKAILSGAQFCDANLYSVNFLGCTVGQTDFTGAYLEQTIFKDWRPS